MQKYDFPNIYTQIIKIFYGNMSLSLAQTRKKHYFCSYGEVSDNDVGFLVVYRRVWSGRLAECAASLDDG